MPVKLISCQIWKDLDVFAKYWVNIGKTFSQGKFDSLGCLEKFIMFKVGAKQRKLHTYSDVAYKSVAYKSCSLALS